MKAITVLQPWATLLVTGKKHIETRSWKTNYRGEILIHAGKKDPLFGFCMMTDDTKKRVLRVLGLPEIFNRFQKFPTGEILGKAILADCVLIDKEIAALIKEQRPDEYAFGEHKIYGCVLRKPDEWDEPKVIGYVVRTIIHEMAGDKK